ncbi:hypothetical protein ES703_92790 [subsurface metagenome]
MIYWVASTLVWEVIGWGLMLFGVYSFFSGLIAWLKSLGSRIDRWMESRESDEDRGKTAYLTLRGDRRLKLFRLRIRH